MLGRASRLVVSAVLSLFALTSCTHGHSASAPRPHSDSTKALKVLALPVPALKVPRYDTTGRFPQVSLAGLDLGAVNGALRDAVEADQSAYRPSALAQVSGEAQDDYRGVYELDFDPTLMVANTVVVSTMYPSLELYPGGNDGSSWISTTVLVPSGRPVALADLFPKGSSWLVKLAALTRQEALAEELCNPLEPENRWAFEEGLAAKPANYGLFALTADGLDLGMVQGQFGAEACGANRVTIPWSKLRADLSVEGQRLATAATQGLSTAPCSLRRISDAFASRALALRTVRIDETAMTVHSAGCDTGWALGYVAPPDHLVTQTSGEEIVLFKAAGLGWQEVDVVAAANDGGYAGGDLTTCDLASRGVPADVAARLLAMQPTDKPC